MKYITDSAVAELTCRRVDDYDTKRQIKSKWTVVEDGCTPFPSPNARIGYSHDGVAQIVSDMDLYKYTPTYLQISSALALYRTISLFECGIRTSSCDYYKVNWQVVLKHKKENKEQENNSEEKNSAEQENDEENEETYEEEQNNYLILSEWKGAFTAHLTGSLEYMDEEYKKDAVRLMTLLAFPKMSIGYDGTVAGEVA